MSRIEGTVGEGGAVRLDRYVADELKAVSRSQFKARFVSAAVNGRDAKPSRPLKPGDAFVVTLLDEEDRSSASESEDIPLSVLYEDAEVLVLDKPQGMVVHPAHGNWSGTLANALLGRLGAAADGAPPRAGIVHRLDKDTSGVIVAGKTARGQEFLAAQFRARTTVKTYIALVRWKSPRAAAGASVPGGPGSGGSGFAHGSPGPARSGRIEGWLARDPRDRKRFAPSPEGVGKKALTEWRLVAEAGGYAILALGLRTGRTHQLRVHCKALGCPILGDPVYGEADKRFPTASLMLHALELRIRLPGREDPSVFLAPVPERFLTVASALGIDPFPDALAR